ncbi:MAG: tetratricopeptide repeat protein [Desulfatitalea sp.]|nr:tetratricopeptide repeat protein [Desulfatitalea sp.]
MEKKFLERLKWMLAFIMALLVLRAEVTFAQSALEILKQLDINQAGTLDEMKSSLEYLQVAANSPEAGKYEYQKRLLELSGECVSKLMALYASGEKSQSPGKDQFKDLFLVNHDILMSVFTRNDQVIRDFQENRLDQMEDPFVLFNSSEWQQPQSLISFSSYWMGWNSYYRSLFFPENDMTKKQILSQAIDAFSSAFVGFSDDDFVIKTIFGRALCYRQSGQFQKAINDFESVKEKIKKDDLIYLRCCYEEASIRYEVGNVSRASHLLEHIRTIFQSDKIPDELNIGLERLRSKILFSEIKKNENATEDDGNDNPKALLKRLSELKKLAAKNNTFMPELYRFSRAHGDKLHNLPYEELGPMSALAIGDYLFESKAYPKCFSLYETIYKASPEILNNRMDGICFRLGYLCSERRQWDKAVHYLRPFHKNYPGSKYRGQATRLYYVAAFNEYHQKRAEKAYQTYIDAARNYISQCQGQCPEMDDAYLQVANYYQQKGKHQFAIDNYQNVSEASSNYVLARFNILTNYMQALKIRETNGKNEREGTKTHQDAIRSLKAFNSVIHKKGSKREKEKLIPHLVIIEAKLNCRQDVNPNTPLEILDCFEERFSDAKTLFPEVTQIRIKCHHQLGQLDYIQKELDRCVSTAHFGRNDFLSLFSLSREFQNQAEIGKDGTETNETKQSAAIALMIYRALSDYSRQNISYMAYATSLQLKMAGIYTRNRQYENAISLYKEILAYEPLSADAVYGLGLLYENTGQWREALDTWRKFSDGLKPGTTPWFESRYRTACALSALGKPDKACTVLTMTMVLHPSLGDAVLAKKYSELEKTICGREAS